MGKILPVLLAVLGIAAGIGAGLLLRPDPADDTARGMQDCIPAAGDAATPDTPPPAKMDEPASAFDYVRMNNQFVVPLVQGERVSALVVVSISLEVRKGQREDVFAVEPKLRDAMLQVMFAHANTGGFQGAFTNPSSMDSLRRGLLAAARSVMGPDVSDVLITDIARQDV